MDFNLTKMQVENFAFSDKYKGVEGERNTFKIEAALMLSESDEKLAKLVTEICLRAPGKYEIEGTLSFLFKFNEKVTAEKAQELLEQSKSEKLIFPYVHAFLTNFIMSAGYPRPGIPLVIS